MPRSILTIIAAVVLIISVLIIGVGLQRKWLENKPATFVQNRGTTISDANTDIQKANNSFIEQLRSRDFTGGEIKIEETLSSNGTYTSYLISYPSDNLKIYGIVNTPNGEGPFPVIILNHGYYSPSSFISGDGTKTMADILARNGYLTLAPDYRGHGNSDSDGGRGGHRPEYSIDVLNLLASINNINKADPKRIGMWGHSMGGEVSMRAIEATDKVKAVALWAPTSANAADNHAFYGGGRNRPANSAPEIDGTSPINYLKYISASISIHQGLADTEVKPEWSVELKNALEKERKSVEYFEYEGQDHNFRNLGWDLISQRTLEFYNKYLKE